MQTRKKEKKMKLFTEEKNHMKVIRSFLSNTG